MPAGFEIANNSSASAANKGLPSYMPKVVLKAHAKFLQVVS